MPGEHDDSRKAFERLLGLDECREVAAADHQLIHATVGARRTFFEPLGALTTYLPFESWACLLKFMMREYERRAGKMN